ncbi:MAG: hypothetical protein ACRDQZ_19785, partial [Mycobacteriales bacterium]
MPLAGVFINPFISKTETLRLSHNPAMYSDCSEWCAPPNLPRSTMPSGMTPNLNLAGLKGGVHLPFTRELMAEEEAGRPNFAKLRAEQNDHQIEKVGSELRDMMA